MTEDTPRTTADPWLRTDNGWSCNVPWHRLRQAQAEASAVPGALREALEAIEERLKGPVYRMSGDIAVIVNAALSREEATSE